jgi:hypothetical protein
MNIKTSWFLAFLASILSSTAFAATIPNSVQISPNTVTLPVTPEFYYAQISNTTGTTLVAFATSAATNGSQITSISCSSTDTVAHTLYVYRVHSATNYLITTVSIPATAGDSTTIPPVQILNTTNVPGPIDPNGNRYLSIADGDSISISVSVAVTASDFISCVGHGSDY